MLPASPALAHNAAVSIKDLEKHLGARLGVALRDTGSGASFDYRGGERFPLCTVWVGSEAAKTADVVHMLCKALGTTVALTILRSQSYFRWVSERGLEPPRPITGTSTSS